MAQNEPAQPGRKESTGSTDRIDALLETLFAEDSDYRVVLERLCADHPDFESELRRRVERLEAHGILDPDTPTPLFPVVGDRFGPWELLDLLGRGAMGVVFLARRAGDQGAGEVALKLVQPTLVRSGLARFAREAQSLQALDHPNLCRLIEVGETSSTPWIAMERIEGRSLAERIHEERNELHAASMVGDSVRMAARLARGLALAHALGIVHRDIKPANILVREDGEPVLIDFGLARLLDRTRLTESHRPIGTPAYMAPEQVRGEDVGVRADVYGLGAVLYEMLTLRPPFESASREDLFRRILSDELESPRRGNPDVPAPLANVICKCLEKDPNRRYADAGELADELDRFLHGRSVRARRPSPVRLLARRVRRRPARAMGAAIVGLTFVLALVLAKNSRLASEAFAGSLLSGLYSQRYGEEALTVAASAYGTFPSLQTRSQFYRLWVGRRFSGRWVTPGREWMHAAVSPDGQALAIAAAPDQPERYLWLDTGQAGESPFERVLVAEGGHVAWAPDGVRVAVLVGQKTVRVLTLEPELTAVDYELPGKIQARSFARPARCVAFGPNGDVWVGTANGEVHRLRGGEIESYPVFEGSEDVLALDVDGEFLVAVSRTGRVAVVAPGGEVIARPIDGDTLDQAGVGSARSDRVLLDLERRRLLIARYIDRDTRRDECQLEIWQLPEASRILVDAAELTVGPIDLHDRAVDLAMGGEVAAGEFPFGVLLRRGNLLIGSAEGLTRLALGVSTTHSVMHHDGRFVVTTREGVVLFVGLDGEVSDRLVAGTDTVPLVVPSRDGTGVEAICRDGSTVTIDLHPSDAMVLRPPGDELYAARWRSDGHFVTGTSPHRFALWSRAGEPLVERTLGGSQGLHRLAIGRGTGVIAAAVEKVSGLGFGVRSAVQWLDPETLEVLSTNGGAPGTPRWRGLALTEDERTLFAVDGIRLVRLRRDGGGGDWQLEELAGEKFRYSFEHVGVGADCVVTTGTDGRVEAWSHDGASLGRVRFDVTPTAVAARGGRVHVGFQDGSVRVLRLPDLRALAQLEPHPRRITSIALGQASGLGGSTQAPVAIGSSNGFLSVHRGRETEPWLAFDASAGIVDLDWNGRGDELLVGTSDRRVRVLPDLDETVLRGRAKTQRGR